MGPAHDEVDVNAHVGQLASHEARICTLEEDRVDQWTAINSLRNRLPLWATLAISSLTGALGVTASHVRIP